MNYHQLMMFYSKAKIYIDFGFFPGPERIPREAVTMYCNIITSTTGSAKNNSDVPIPYEFKIDAKDDNLDRIVLKIKNMLVNYNDDIPRFEQYRKKLLIKGDYLMSILKNISLDNMSFKINKSQLYKYGELLFLVQLFLLSLIIYCLIVQIFLKLSLMSLEIY